MIVKVDRKLYRITEKQYEELLQVAKEQVSKGIYAVKRGNYAELSCTNCSSMTQLKTLTRQYKAQGFKVYANKGEDG